MKLAFFLRIKRRSEKKGKISDCMKEILEAVKLTEKTSFRRWVKGTQYAS
jgi:hypothetical protein